MCFWTVLLFPIHFCYAKRDYSQIQEGLAGFLPPAAKAAVFPSSESFNKQSLLCLSSPYPYTGVKPEWLCCHRKGALQGSLWSHSSAWFIFRSPEGVVSLFSLFLGSGYVCHHSPPQTQLSPFPGDKAVSLFLSQVILGV